MRKLFKSIATALCIGVGAGSFALGDGVKASADLTYTDMDELPMLSASPEKSEAPEVREEEETSEVPVSSEKDEAPTTSEPPSASITPETSEAPETPHEEKSGCGSVVSGVYALLSLAGAGFAMAIRKKKE